MPRLGSLLPAAGLLALYCLVAVWLPPTDDELYYWCWAKQLQLSYYDHPAMTALFIRGSVEVFGDTLFAVRLPACLATVGVLGVLWHLTRPQDLLAWVVVTPLYTLGAVLVTPDTPLLLFWALYLLWHTKAQARLSEHGRIPPWLWAVGGVTLGCGVLGKYTMGLAVPAGFVAFALSGVSWRRWLPGYVGHGVVSAVVASPILLFNVQRDFAPLRYQWGHAMAPADPGGWHTLGAFVGVQLLLAGTLPFVLLPWAWANLRTLARDPRLRACVAFYAVPLSFFLVKAAKGPLEGNWALACYLGFWPVAAYWYAAAQHRPRWRWLTGAAFGVPTGATAVLIVHLVSPLWFVPPAADRVSRQAPRVAVAAAAAAAIRADGEALPVYAPTYQWVALLRFHGIDARQIDDLTRPSHFTPSPERLEAVPRAYVFNEGPLPPAFAGGFREPTLVAHFPLTVRGQTVSGFQVFVYGR